MTPHAGGMDLYAAVTDNMILAPGERALVPTGIAIALPEGCEAQIRPRSGLAIKHGITFLNATGTIDADYLGEIKIIMANLAQEAFTIRRGERIAQMVVAPVLTGTLLAVEQLPETEHNSGGFGHTGR